MAGRFRTYPDTPAGRARQLRDADDAYLSDRGHSLKWRRGHGVRWLRGEQGWRGRCERCGDLIAVADLGGGGHAVYRSYTDADGQARSMRKCAGRRRR
jgi:hypothetical protein